MPEYTSRLSVPITFSNVLDPISVKADFVYNFYVSNEDKEYSPNNASPIDYNKGLVSQQTIQSIEAKSRGDLIARVPRYTKISIIPKSANFEWDTLPELTPSLETKILNTDGSAKMQNINLEGAIQNRYVANSSIVDSAVKERVQREVYRVSEAVLKSGGVLGDMSDESLANELNLSLSDDVDAGIILDVLSDNSVKGFKFSNEILSERYSRVETRSKIQQRVSFNGKCFREIISPICVGNPFSAYFETDVLGNSANRVGLVPNSLLDESLFPDFRVTDSEESIRPKLVFLTDSVEQTTKSQFKSISRNYPKVNHIGYIIEKYSESPTGKYETHSSQVLFGRLTTEFIDPNIKYGYTYFYKVRQLYLVSTIQITNIDNARSMVRYQILTCAVASSAPPAARVVARETDVPNPPSVLIPEYNHSDKSLRIEWANPTNPSRDIKKYQVFRRKRLNDPFEIIAEYDFSDEDYTAFNKTEQIDPSLIKKVNRVRTYHVDREFDENTTYIYCVASVDAHGLCSNYGTQIQVKFNQYKNNIETRIISRSGAPKAYPNYYVIPTELDQFGSDRLIEDVIKDSGHGTMKIYFNPDAYKLQSDSIAASETDRIVLSQDKGTYKMQIINLDRQISKIFEAKIEIDPSLSSLL